MKFLAFVLIAILGFSLTAEPITVHIIPHTHDDLGWVLTVQEYYDQRVKNILDNMMVSLAADPQRTFIYVEQAFFRMWYPNQTTEVKTTLKSWLAEGRFEFIMGGYVMHDESASHFQHSIDQMRLGLQFLKEEFNFIPKTAWFIDPFGHSSSNAYILSEMGFERIVFVRIDYKEKDIRKADGTLEFNWTPYKDLDLKKQTTIFTHITSEHYCPFDGFGELIGDNLVNWDDNTLTFKAKDFAQKVKGQSKGYKHNQLMFWAGCDFTFQKANVNYQNLEALMNKIKTMPELEIIVQYSTPTKYFDAVKNELETKKIEIPTYENNDFFPYADNDFAYWSGYFTSRINLKVKIREAGNTLESSSQLLTEAILNSKLTSKDLVNFDAYYNKIYTLREKLAINQHHDAVAGTSKNYVSDDYETMLGAVRNDVTDNVITNLAADISSVKQTEIKACVQGYSNSCDEIVSNFDAEGFAQIDLFNNRISYNNFAIKFQVKDSKLDMFLSDKKTRMENDIVCQPTHDLKIDYPCTIFFNLNLDKNVPFTRVYLKKVDIERKIDFKVSSGKDNSFSLNNVKFTVHHNDYEGYSGQSGCETKSPGHNNDGAYIFSTCKFQPVENQITRIHELNKTSKVIEYQKTIEYANTLVHVRKYFNNEFLEVESVYDPFKIDAFNKLLHIKSDINNTIKINNKEYLEMWTDSNSLKMMRRIKDYRRDWNYTVTDAVSGNFYPTNFSASIRDRVLTKDYFENDYLFLNKKDRVLSVYNERSQSSGVMNKGEIMIIQQRSSLKDDSRGKDEPLYEHSSAERYYSIYHYISASFTNEGFLYDFINFKPIVFNTITSFPKLEYNSILQKLLKTDCLVNIQVLAKNKFFLQLFNRSDPYFTNKKSDCYYKFNEVESLNYTVKETNKNGTEFSDKEVQINFLKEKINLLSDKNIDDYKLEPQTYILFLIKLN